MTPLDGLDGASNSTSNCLPVELTAVVDGVLR